MYFCRVEVENFCFYFVHSGSVCYFIRGENPIYHKKSEARMCKISQSQFCINSEHFLCNISYFISDTISNLQKTGVHFINFCENPIYHKKPEGLNLQNFSKSNLHKF